ncbi:SMP-30/gluconolactonase/LRE family protein [Sphaerisporangium sp. B11E5]|uniref:SMP-30/gluconolactonase/LRE family protein n=1 Tax=Sphaerisporangium sp. B11E5 TaxID=3153563 RepID=UPI00325C58FA
MSPHDVIDAVPRWPAAVASAEVFGLGEGPVWDPARDRVLWVDIDAGTVHEGRLDGDRIVCTGSHHVDRTAGAVAVAPSGDLLVAGTHALVTVTTEGARVSGPVILPPGSGRRLNDGACDPAGAFLVGSMTLDEEAAGTTEVLVRVERDGRVTVLDDDLALSNGLAWSADGTVLYSVDTLPGRVWARPYDAATGAVGPRREWLHLAGGLPDGLCVDAEDHVWVAVWGGGQVRRYTPDGVLAGVVDVPAPHTTSMAFVGDRLLITTAAFGLTEEQRAEYPDSGRLFLADPGTTGLPPRQWSGG